MNIADYRNDEGYKDYLSHGIIHGIFFLEDSLTDEYVRAEAEFHPTSSVNIRRHLDITVPNDQLIIKIQAQRVMEELGEMAMAEFESNEEHAREEVVDALAFATQLMILIDGTPEEHPEDLFADWYVPVEKISVIDTLCAATNALKNKTWKREAVPIDTRVFKRRINRFYDLLLLFASQTFGGKPLDLFKAFYAKYRTNKFRQESNY